MNPTSKRDLPHAISRECMHAWRECTCMHMHAYAHACKYNAYACAHACTCIHSRAAHEDESQNLGLMETPVHIHAQVLGYTVSLKSGK